MLRIFGSIDINFGCHHNTKYGLDEFVEMLIIMCRNGGTARSAAAELHYMVDEQTQTSKWFLNMVNSISWEDCERACRMLLDAVSQPCNMERLMGKHHLVAIDKHEMERYDKDMMYLIYSKFKNGTCKFECYATMQIVGEEYNPTLDGRRVTRLTSEVDFVRKFIENLRKTGMLVDTMLLDREFYSADVMSEIDRSAYRFLMPAIKNSRIVKAIQEHHMGMREAVSEFVIRKGQDNEFTFTLVIAKSKKFGDPDASITKQYHAFATNMPPGEALEQIRAIPEEYRLRWGIETRYRQIDDVRPWTVSKNNVYRLLLFYLAVFMCNMWAEIRLDCGMPPKEMTLRLMLMLAARGISRIARKPSIQMDPYK